MRIVLDANVYIGAEISRKGVSSKTIKLFTHPNTHLELILTEKIILEIKDVLTRPRIMKLTKKYVDEVQVAIEDYAQLSIMVPDMPISSHECRDPKDLIYLAAADTSKADLIVSWDKDLLDLIEFRGTKIIKPDEFVRIANQVF